MSANMSPVFSFSRSNIPQQVSIKRLHLFYENADTVLLIIVNVSWSALLLINPFISFISSQPCVLSQKWVLELEWGTNLRILIEVVLQIIDQHSTCFFYVTSAWCHHKRTWYHWTTTTISVSSFYNALFWLIFSWPQAEFVVGQLIIGLTFRATYMILALFGSR